MAGLLSVTVDLPIKAVVGGLHLPVQAIGTPLLRQAVTGNPNWPWRPIGESDITRVVEAITARGPLLVAVSGHDSTLTWKTRFEHRWYRKSQAPDHTAPVLNTNEAHVSAGLP